MINPGAASERLAAPEFGSKAFDVPLGDGEVISQCTAGGGGWGDPAERDPDSVARDVRLGYVSAVAAKDTYLVVLDEMGQVRAEQTLALRRARSEQPTAVHGGTR